MKSCRSTHFITCTGANLLLFRAFPVLPPAVLPVDADTGGDNDGPAIDDDDEGGDPILATFLPEDSTPAPQVSNKLPVEKYVKAVCSLE